MTEQYGQTNINSPRSVRSFATDALLNFDDDLVVISGGATVTLPDARQIPAFELCIKSPLGTGFVATVGGQTIDGSPSFAFTIPLQALCLKSDGANWAIIANVTTGGGGVDLQTAYDNGINGNITLSAANGPVQVRDAAVPLGGNLFAVQNNAGATDFFSVTVAGVGVTGTGVFTGNVTASNLQRGAGNPNTVASGALGDAFQRTDVGGELYINNDGVTGWTLLGTSTALVDTDGDTSVRVEFNPGADSDLITMTVGDNSGDYNVSSPIFMASTAGIFMQPPEETSGAAPTPAFEITGAAGYYDAGTVVITGGLGDIAYGTTGGQVEVRGGPGSDAGGVLIEGGVPDAAGAGGSVVIRASAGGATSTDAASVTLQGSQPPLGVNQGGGDVVINAGQAQGGAGGTEDCGDIDLNAPSSVGTGGAGNIRLRHGLAPLGTNGAIYIERGLGGVGDTGEVRFVENDVAENYVGFKAPQAVAANVVFEWPGADGSLGDALSTDGAGALAFRTPAGAPLLFSCLGDSGAGPVAESLYPGGFNFGFAAVADPAIPHPSILPIGGFLVGFGVVHTTPIVGDTYTYDVTVGGISVLTLPAVPTSTPTASIIPAAPIPIPPGSLVGVTLTAGVGGGGLPVNIVASVALT